MMDISAFRNSPKLSIALAASTIGFFFDFIGICVSQANWPTQANSILGTNPLAIMWFYLFFYLFWIMLITFAVLSNSVPTYRFLLLAFTAITIAFLPDDMNQSLNWTVLKAPSSGLALKVAGLIMFFFPVLAVLVILGSEQDSFVHMSQITLPVFGASSDVDVEKPSEAPVVSTFPASSFPVQHQQHQQHQQSAPEAFQAPSYFREQANQEPIVQTTAPTTTPATTAEPLAEASNNAAVAPQQFTAPSSTTVAAPDARLPTSPEPRDSIIAFKAKALYAYEANPSDPNEISFKKGDILNVIDSKGKWWHVQRVNEDGSFIQGIAPSNYLQSLN